jgi:hypothetical protein
MGGGGGLCPDNAAPGNAAGARCGGERGGKGGGEAGEQQIRAPGDPCFSFSSSSFSLCIRRGFVKKSCSRQCRTPLLGHFGPCEMALSHQSSAICGPKKLRNIRSLSSLRAVCT